MYGENKIYERVQNDALQSSGSHLGTNPLNQMQTRRILKVHHLFIIIFVTFSEYQKKKKVVILTFIISICNGSYFKMKRQEINNLLSRSVQFSSVQFSSVAQSCLTLCDPMNCSTPGLPVHHHLLESIRLTSIESVMPSSHLILCKPLLLLPPIVPSIRVFSSESTLRMRWSKYQSFSFSIIPSKEIPGLISFRMDWLDLLAVQGTLKSLLQHHSSKASILQRSAFFTV